jgi:hypothetical protein
MYMETVDWHIMIYAHIAKSALHCFHQQQMRAISPLNQASSQNPPQEWRIQSSRRGTGRVPGSSPSRQPSCE